jgi:hypothetical protein
MSSDDEELKHKKKKSKKNKQEKPEEIAGEPQEGDLNADCNQEKSKKRKHKHKNKEKEKDEIQVRIGFWKSLSKDESFETMCTQVHTANNWEEADLGDEDRKKKFLKLMGATKVS